MGIIYRQKKEFDPKFLEILKFSIENEFISTSLLQRKFSLGYGRAAKLIDTMEDMGIVAEKDGQSPRRVLARCQNPEEDMKETDLEVFLKTLIFLPSPKKESPSTQDTNLLKDSLDIFGFGNRSTNTQKEMLPVEFHDTPSVCICLSDGFEMIETLTPYDVLKRAGYTVNLVSISGKRFVTSNHGVTIEANLALRDVFYPSVQMLILPGGMPGAQNLYECKELIRLLKVLADEETPIAAICAAPFILGKCGLLSGKKATCYPGFEKDLDGATVVNEGVVRDGNIITAKGMGASLDFALAITELLSGKEKRDEIAHAIMYE